MAVLCTDPQKLDGLKIRFDVKEFGIGPDSFRLIWLIGQNST